MTEINVEVESRVNFSVLEAEFSREDLLHLHSSMVTSLKEEIGETNDAHLSITARHEDGALLGGLSGSTFRGWLTIEILWVRSDWRRRGVGAGLVRAAEHEALRRGCRAAHFDTFSPGAVRFYERSGYTVACVLGAPGVDVVRYSLFKTLDRESLPSDATGT